MLEPISKIIEKSINRVDISRQVQAAQVCHFWQEVARGIFGEDAVKKSQAIRLKDGALTVAVLSSVLAQEFKFKEEEIKKGINSKAGENVVRKIRFEI